MKIENKVKASVSGLSIPKVIGKMSHVLTSITNNTNFVLVPEPTVAAAMLSELQVLEGRVAAGDRTAVPLRTNKLAEVISLLNSWVAQVNVQAQGNVARLESSGFEFVRVALLVDESALDFVV